MEPRGQNAVPRTHFDAVKRGENGQDALIEWFIAVGFFGDGGVQDVSVDGWKSAELNREVENLFAALPG